MKKILVSVVGLLSGLTFLPTTNALADAPPASGPEFHDRVVRDSTTNVVVELTPATVFCTSLGYGNVQLKINVPDLDWLAHFDHRVVGEGQPCIAGGTCTADLSPTSVIDPDDKFAIVPLRIVLTESLAIDRTAKTCTRYLTEDVHATVRGHEFSHERSGGPDVVDFDKCVRSVGL